MFSLNTKIEYRLDVYIYIYIYTTKQIEDYKYCIQNDVIGTELLNTAKNHPLGW